ncbi:SusC/RagA family TonB-linked outer membrane protein [Pedobacter rhizosphaerae]|uniref:TonB-linked outer membrane protein, SusC/RagA family n=1 Tax=Pedobacter rhizosphaerae TaxID=390241 RepID=A0A1H9MM72_9SPHI|nr:TonB-dependent receptor [Pedobacter rhizosphaerae]SER24629.1 TonB-linked outer membrane protein, SusC/RagA family [Pedobacter rhizosphaerae]
MKINIYAILTFCLCILNINLALAQGQTIEGTVRDKDGIMVGVTIKERGFANTVVTNSDGKYRITLKGKTGILDVKFVGYLAKEIVIGERKVINIELVPENNDLEEVVVLAFGKQKKVTTTGSLSTISGEQIRQNPSASLQNTLVGKLPGFSSQQRSGRPGADGAEFFIRGVSSYNSGSNAPLIMVDDIEYTYEQFSLIDANEIESLSILKDASTTAIFGVKGANGVVIVTTRRGKLGRPQISVRNEFSVMQPTMMPEFLDSYESALLYNQARVNDGLTPRFTPNDLQKYQDGSDPYGHPNNNWKEILFKDFSKQIKGNFDISGGTEKVKYFISTGYLSQDGILNEYGNETNGVNSNFFYNRYNYRSNLDVKATKTLDLRIDLYGNIGITNRNNIASAFGYNDIFYDYVSFYSLAPWNYPIYNPDGSYGYSTWQRDENPNYNQNNMVGRIAHYGYNRTFDNNMNFVGSGNQKLDFITEGLSLKGVVSYASEHSYTRSMTRDQFPSFIYDPNTNTYAPRDANIYRVRRYFIGYAPGSTVRKLNTQLFLNYDRNFAKHHVYGLALMNRNTVLKYNSNNVYNFIPANFRGYSGRVGYDFDDKYLFQFNAAYNGSDRFGDKKYGFFPAVSAGWNISSEKFMKDNLKFINFLKLRGSYGVVGNDKLGDNYAYYYLQNYYQGGNANFGSGSNNYNGFYEGTLGNNEVSWEKEKKLDVALEFGLFDNKISGTIDVFRNERYDIMTTRGTVSSVFGVGLPPVNLGRVRNQGGELELTYRDRFGEFGLSVSGNVSIAKNKILFQDEPTAAYPYQQATGNAIGSSLLYKWIGYYTSAADIASSPVPTVTPRVGDLKYEDLNGDGKINSYDMAYIGLPNLPNTYYGLNLGFNYRNFSLTVSLQGALNYNIRAVAEAVQAFSSNFMSIHQNSWNPELGDAAQYPLLSFNPGISSPSAFPSTFWSVKGNYLRLKNAEFGYTLPQKFLNKIKVQSIRTYVNGYNLLTWSNLSSRYQFDPEANTGRDRIEYPPQRMFNFGINVTF